MPGTLGEGDHVATFVKKMSEWSDGINGSALKGIRDGSLAAKRLALASLAGRNRLKNVGKGARLGVTYDIKGTVNPTSLIRATGPWQFIEHRIRPHLIVPRGAKGLGRSRAARQRNLHSHLSDLFGSSRAHFGRRAALKMPGSPSGFAAYAHHPGVHRGGGGGPWARALPAMKEATRSAMVKAQRDTMAKIFGLGG